MREHEAQYEAEAQRVIDRDSAKELVSQQDIAEKQAAIEGSLLSQLQERGVQKEIDSGRELAHEQAHELVIRQTMAEKQALTEGSFVNQMQLQANV